MPNRSLQVKFERAKRQVRELAHQEYSKCAYVTRKPDVAAIIASYDGPIRRFAAGVMARKDSKLYCAGRRI